MDINLGDFYSFNMKTSKRVSISIISSLNLILQEMMRDFGIISGEKQEHILKRSMHIRSKKFCKFSCNK